jgi:hypothetical protein
VVIDWNDFELSDETYDRLMSYPGVHTICLGRKEVGGRRTEVDSIQLLVSRKIARDELDPSQIIPAEIQGVPTDVVEQQDFHISAAKCPRVDDTEKVRPLTGGVQISALHCVSPDGSGTLGGIARTRDTNQKVLLSNAHVIGEKDSYVGDKVGQPAMCSVCSACCSDPVATVLRSKLTAHVDGAVAVLNAGIDGVPQIKEIGAVAGVRHLTRVEAQSAVQVQKRGAASGLTFGLVVGWIPKKEIQNHNGSINRIGEDFLRIVPRAPSVCWVQDGDSGSLVLDSNRNVVGLLFGGTDDGQAGFACPIQFVEDELNIDILTATTLAPVTTTTVAADVVARVAAHPGVRVVAETPAGRAALEQFERYFDELRTLVRTERRVTVAWRRNGGPGMLQAFTEALDAPGMQMPAEIDGRPLPECVERIVAAIRPHASPALRADLDGHLTVLKGCGGLTLSQVAARLAGSTAAV